MTSSVCTLFDGSYHYGLGAFANSLHAHGFRGVIWAGYRGSLPAWAVSAERKQEYAEFKVADSTWIRFLPLSTERHLTNFKPDFMLQVFETDPSLQALFYFDPDIVVRCRWSFYEEWIEHGVALVQDITNSTMPANHPIRLKWIALAASLGFNVHREINQYFNCGFIGIKRDHLPFLHTWQTCLTATSKEGMQLTQFMTGDRTHPIYSADQDTLNMTATVTTCALSTIGPEGMDFLPGGFTMSHAIGSPKPWSKNMTLSALDGRGPNAADQGFWSNVIAPIRLHSPWHLWVKKLDLLLGRAIGRFSRRS